MDGRTRAEIERIARRLEAGDNTESGAAVVLFVLLAAERDGSVWELARMAQQFAVTKTRRN